MRCMFFISFWLLAKVGRDIIYILQESHIFVFPLQFSPRPITTLIGREDACKSGRCITRFAVGKLKMRVMPVTIRTRAGAGLNCNVFPVHKDLILNSLYISMVFSIIKKSKWTKGTRFAGWMATCHEETYIEEREANGEKH